LDTPASEGRCGPDEQGIGPIAPDIFEGGIDLAAGVGVENLDLQSEGASGRFDVSQCRRSIRGIGGADEHGDASGPR
jgi:hypothetical protein